MKPLAKKLVSGLSYHGFKLRKADVQARCPHSGATVPIDVVLQADARTILCEVKWWGEAQTHTCHVSRVSEVGQVLREVHPGRVAVVSLSLKGHAAVLHMPSTVLNTTAPSWSR